MIVKNEEYKYKVGHVSSGVNNKEKHWTRFSVGDFNKHKNRTTYVNVMAWFEMDLQDGDEVTFLDYHVGVDIYNGKQQATIFLLAPEDVIIANKVESVLSHSVADLPWLLGEKK